MEPSGDVGARFRSITEAIETTTPAGGMMMQMVIFASTTKSRLSVLIQINERSG